MSAPPSADSGRLDELFWRQATATPDRPAIEFRGQILRYADLQSAVERLSLALAERGVGPGVLVALALRRTPDLIIALLATLRAGGAFLALDTRTPAARNGFMLADSGCQLVLAGEAAVGLGGFGGALLALDGGSLEEVNAGRRPTATVPPGAAYVIYTSGSAGQPKGVVLGHDATHLVAWATRAYSAAEREVVAATTSLAFDPAIFEIFVPLCTGGRLLLKEDALEPFGPDERPTLLDTVPSVLAELCRAQRIPESVRVLNVGGERLSADLVRSVYAACPGVRLDNHYGPTEATTVATVARIPRQLAGEPPIGVAVRGAEIRLLDASDQAVAPGEIGEIHIGGPGLALGYIGRADLTAARFPVIGGQRLYRTGDLGRWEDGQLLFAGRMDRQVKVRGVRVELGEVEAALLRVGGVEAAFAEVERVGERSQLVAYVAAPGLTELAVRDRLSTWLPGAMRPARIVVLPDLPRLVSGKLDVAALRAPDREVRTPPSVQVLRMERPIVHVFAEILGRSDFGPKDSFFDLGGDSLSSVQAALRLEELLGYELPPALIHQAPTARSLARALQHGRVREESHLSLLQAGGPEPPLFCLADITGHAFNYLNLAGRLAPERSVYGIAPGPAQRRFTQTGDVAALTQSFLAEIRALRPSGPYHLAGYSAGGMLAVDLACALERQGETVRLVLLDATHRGGRTPMAALLPWAGRQARTYLTTAVESRGGAAHPRDWLPRSQLPFALRLMRAAKRFKPPPFTGKTLLVKAAQADPLDQLHHGDGKLGWAEVLKGGVTVIEAPGDHREIMREPRVAIAAQAARRFLSAGPEEVMATVGAEPSGRRPTRAGWPARP